MKKLMVLAALLMLLLVGCVGPQAVTNAQLRDTIFSIEHRVSGVTMIWVTHDDVGIYCTDNAQIIQTATEIFQSDDPTAILGYRSLNTNDPQFNIFGLAGCSHTQGINDSTVVYLLTSIGRP